MRSGAPVNFCPDNGRTVGNQLREALWLEPWDSYARHNYPDSRKLTKHGHQYSWCVPDAFRSTVSWNSEMYVPYNAFHMRSVQTFRKKWNTVLRFMRSICVPCNPSAKRTNNHSAGMRSNAFRATLPQISKIPMRSYAFRLSSYTFLLICLNICQNSHAFLCVPSQLWHEIEQHTISWP